MLHLHILVIALKKSLAIFVDAGTRKLLAFFWNFYLLQVYSNFMEFSKWVTCCALVFFFFWSNTCENAHFLFSSENVYQNMHVASQVGGAAMDRRKKKEKQRTMSCFGLWSKSLLLRNQKSSKIFQTSLYWNFMTLEMSTIGVVYCIVWMSCWLARALNRWAGKPAHDFACLGFAEGDTN